MRIQLTLFEKKTSEILKQDALRMACLKAVRSLKLPDGQIAAGFLRNAIWDVAHYKGESTPLNDVDVIYYDPQDRGGLWEHNLEQRLAELVPDVNWQVRNQVRMHRKHNHTAYYSCEDALSRWVEVPTCVGVKLLDDGTFDYTAPFGLAVNWSLKLQANPMYPPAPGVFEQRIQEKQWLELWPQLQLISERPENYASLTSIMKNV